MQDAVAGYRLIDLLQQDGLLRRYRAARKDERGRERQVRLTVIGIDAELHPEAADRLDRDAAAAARLAHDHVLGVLDHGRTEDGAPFICTEAVEGKRLDELTQEAPLPPPLAMRVALDVAHALAAAHGAEPPIVHGAMRPSSVVVDATGAAHLNDFGLASALGALASAHTSVLQDVCCYYAPEQVSSDYAVPASDRFTLGSVLYEAMSGQPAFVAPSALAVTLKISMAKLPPMDGLGGDDRIVRLLERLLQRKPEARPSATDLVAELEALVGDEGSTRRELGARVAPPEPAHLPAVPAASLADHAAFDDYDPLDEMTARNVELPNHVPTDVSLPLPAEGRFSCGDDEDDEEPTRVSEPFSPVVDRTAPLSLDAESLEADPTAVHEGLGEHVAALDAFGPMEPDDGSGWVEPTTRMAQGEGGALGPLAPIAPTPIFGAGPAAASAPQRGATTAPAPPTSQGLGPPASAPAAAGPPPAAVARSSRPSSPSIPARASGGSGLPPPLLWTAVGLGAVALIVFVALLTVWLAS